MGRRSQERMTEQTFETRVRFVGVRERMLAEAKAEEDRRYAEALAALIKKGRRARVIATG